MKSSIFAVIRYYIRAFGQETQVWERVQDPGPDPQPNFITSKEARALIAENNMEKVYEYKDGAIWDFPDHRWTNRWKGIFKQRRNAKSLEAKIRAMKKAVKNKNL